MGFSYTQNIANFDVIYSNILLSANLLFLKSITYTTWCCLYDITKDISQKIIVQIFHDWENTPSFLDTKICEF